jgi:hypothetical protein
MLPFSWRQKFCFCDSIWATSEPAEREGAVFQPFYLSGQMVAIFHDD